jgi:hypothetical protein
VLIIADIYMALKDFVIVDQLSELLRAHIQPKRCQDSDRSQFLMVVPSFFSTTVGAGPPRLEQDELPAKKFRRYGWQADNNSSETENGARANWMGLF